MSSKSIFILVLIAFIAAVSTCKLEITTLCDAIKTDLKLQIDLTNNCTCSASPTVCDALNKGAPYDFQILCGAIGLALPSLKPLSCNCTLFVETCKKVEECNADASANKSATVEIMPSSALPDASMMTTSPMMTETMTMESMTVDQTPEPTMSTEMMMSSSSNNGTDKGSSANQIQVGRAAMTLSTLVAGLFFYLI